MAWGSLPRGPVQATDAAWTTDKGAQPWAAVRAGEPESTARHCHILRCPGPCFLWDSREGPGKEVGGAQLCAPRQPPAPQGPTLQTTVLGRQEDVVTALSSS